MTIDMTRHQGDKNLPCIECTNTHLQTYRVRTDFQPDYDEESGDERGVTFIETEFPYKPTLAEVKGFVLGVIDAQTDAKILMGFVWQGLEVWLSTENQFNYKAAFDLAVQTGQNLPVTFKFGSTDAPVYHQFSTLEELTDFYTSAMRYINVTLQEGWQRKDNFDFSPYEEIL